MEVTASEYEKFADILSQDVISKLIGEHANFDRFHEELPSKSILIGNLAQDLSLTADTEKNIDDKKSRHLTNSLSVKFLMKKITDDIAVQPTFSIYYRVFPTFEEQNKYKTKRTCNEKKCKLVSIWKRKIVKFDNITLNDSTTEKSLNFTNFIKSIKETEDILLSDYKVPQSSLNSEEEYNKEIDKLKKSKKDLEFKWEAKVSFNKKKFIQNKEKFDLIEISVINNSPEETDFFEPNLFNPKVKISLNNNQITPFDYEYYYEDYLKNYESPCRCLNCHADYFEDTNEFVTKGYAKFKQNKVTPKSNIPNVDLTFNVLSKKEGLEELTKIHKLMKEHLNTCEKLNNSDKEYKESLNNFDLMQKRFEDGINLLSSNNKAFKSFCLMNTTFERNSEKSDYHSWRLFQIVFIVSLIRDIVDKNHNRDVCELLHVMTGGGKSESYFGLVIFSAFYDRLTGKKMGITAITKFPLRMLSVQQLQRVANLFIWAEEIRKEEKIDGKPFTIAYFVGSSNDFPRHNDELIKEINELNIKKEPKKGQIIERCPICGGEVFLDVDNGQSVVIHRCDSCNRVFRLYFSDDEIYRTLPTFIVATVDKFAGIATQRRVKNLFGGKLDMCPDGHGFMPHKDTCDVQKGYERCEKTGDYLNLSYNTGPTLIIQDEMHLISEGFGTIDSHFETLMETMQEEFTGEKFKNIVMTATVTGAKNQIKELYNKDICAFPPKLEDNYGNDFFFQKETENGKPIVQREILGLKPNTLQFRLTLYILRYISEFIKYVESNEEEFCKDEGFDKEKLEVIIPLYKKLLTYHNKKDDVQAIPFNAHDFVNTLDSTYSIDTRTLTGENNLDYIKETIKLVENYYKNENTKDKLLVVSATSIVSHGVDIDQWNSMIFDGMTRSTSEYIQALSRVGRKKCGIIFLSFRSGRTRDLSFYQHFDEYHNILDYKVETVPLARWTKIGFKQTLTSIFTASVLNYMSNQLEKPLYHLSDFQTAFKDEKNKEELINFIKKVYLCNQGIEESKSICNIIDKEINERIKCLMDSTSTKNTFIVNVLKNSGEKYYNTQFGMRGIQDEITLDSDSTDDFFRRTWKGR